MDEILHTSGYVYEAASTADSLCSPSPADDFFSDFSAPASLDFYLNQFIALLSQHFFIRTSFFFFFFFLDKSNMAATSSGGGGAVAASSSVILQLNLEKRWPPQNFNLTFVYGPITARHSGIYWLVIGY